VNEETHERVVELLCVVLFLERTQEVVFGVCFKTEGGDLSPEVIPAGSGVSRGYSKSSQSGNCLGNLRGAFPIT
jgi:hypothetical protein